MSKIDEQILKLKEAEKHLALEKKKIEFLNHILNSAKEYEHTDFQEVKTQVIDLLEEFTTKAIEAIENSEKLIFGTGQEKSVPSSTSVEVPKKEQPSAKDEKKEAPQLSPQEKLNFSLNHRHLANKRVSVANDQNVEIKGIVVGLDAPYVVVETTTGPVIKVPVDKVVL